MATKDAFLPEFDHEMGMTRRLLERVPDDRLAWKPHERSMTLARLATHLRGQLSVYLRLNEVSVPAIYGPSADERR